MATGLKSSRIMPLDGLAFFTSAITAFCRCPTLADKAPAKSSGRWIFPSSSSSASEHCLLHCATQLRLYSAISFRIEVKILHRRVRRVSQSKSKSKDSWNFPVLSHLYKLWTIRFIPFFKDLTLKLISKPTCLLANLR